MLGFIIKELKGKSPTLRAKLNDNEYVLAIPDVDAISFQGED
jgi:predicted RNase H-like HicB family nuclease